MRRKFGTLWNLYISGNLKKKGRGQGKRVGEFLMDLEAGRDALVRALGGDWWDWTEGSRLFFWRWPDIFQEEARDGSKVYVLGPLPSSWGKQRFPDDPIKRSQLIGKIKKVIRRGYVEDGLVINLTCYFAVPKTILDIRVVYDATKCGLNEQLWAPNFILPSIDQVLQAVDFDAWLGDADLGDCFLNYPLEVSF